MSISVHRVYGYCKGYTWRELVYDIYDKVQIYETTFPSMVVNCFSVHLNVLGTLPNLEVNYQLQTSQNIDQKSD